MSATFTIVVGGERTSVHVQADPGTDPRHALTLAIGCLQAEMADLGNCPAHRTAGEAPAPAASLGWIEQVRELLGEAYRFQSTSPRAQENINAALELIDRNAGVRVDGGGQQ